MISRQGFRPKRGISDWSYKANCFSLATLRKARLSRSLLGTSGGSMKSGGDLQADKPQRGSLITTLKSGLGTSFILHVPIPEGVRTLQWTSSQDVDV